MKILLGLKLSKEALEKIGIFFRNSRKENRKFIKKAEVSSLGEHNLSKKKTENLSSQIQHFIFPSSKSFSFNLIFYYFISEKKKNFWVKNQGKREKRLEEKKKKKLSHT